MYRKIFKRVIDLIAAIIALPFLLIIMLLIGPIIYFSDKGSIFYNAPRLGKDGEVFKMYKFRSMKLNAPDLRNEDGSTFNVENDARLTRVGKFIRKTSLDETPQLLNILKGDMSIIGPRPDLPEMIEMYTIEEKIKLNVQPGITGYSQAYFRNSVNQQEKLKQDVFYAKSYSLILDMKIFFKTLETVIMRKNVFKGEV